MSYNHLSSGGGALVAKLHPTLANPMNCTLLGSSVHGILQARILEWVAISFSRGSSQLRNRTWVSCIAGGFFMDRATKEVHGIIELEEMLQGLIVYSFALGTCFPLSSNI